MKKFIPIIAAVILSVVLLSFGAVNLIHAEKRITTITKNPQNGTVSGTNSSQVVQNEEKPLSKGKTVTLENGLVALCSGTQNNLFRLEFTKNSEGKYGVIINYLGSKTENVVAGKADEMYYQSTPAILSIKPKGEDDNILEEGLKEVYYKVGYDEIKATEYGIEATATITTAGGSKFKFSDNYAGQDDTGAFRFDRQVFVLSTGENELGFSSRMSLFSSAEKGINDFEYFVPGILYKDNSNMVAGSIAENFGPEYIYIKETRMGLPLVMMRDKANGNTISMCHYKPNVTGSENEASPLWLVDNKIQNASLGIHRLPSMQIDFCYPANEGETNYFAPSIPWLRRSHPIDPTIKHAYSVLIKVSKNNDYNSAMMNTWMYNFEAMGTADYKCDISKVYDTSIGLLDYYAQNYNNGMGLPFSVNVTDAKVIGVSYQMGFVGQQIPAAYQMIRNGFKTKNQGLIIKGTAMVDFWAKSSFTDKGFPKVWYDVLTGSFRDYPSYMRIMADGMEGVLDAYFVMKQNNTIKTDWLSACTKFADWLVLNQNSDGSFYRAYNWDGSIFHTSKANTTNPIRYLVRMYELTGANKYLDAALKAGQYSYDNMYLKGKYFGGTADNDNTVDKEAGILAMYAFNSLYYTTNDLKWLKAAEHAGVFAASWTYSYKFRVRGSDPLNLFTNGAVDGLSIIATGHSGADNFIAYTYFDYYRLYLATNNPYYLHTAKFIQNNTKQSTDWDGSLKYKVKGLVQEAVNVSSLNFGGVGAWLPWCTIANIEPISNMEKAFGKMDINDVEKMSATEKEKLNKEFGAGAKK